MCRFSAKELEWKEVSQKHISVLSVELSVESSRLIASMQDRASVNTAAMQTVSIVHPYVLDTGCISHTLDLVGGKFRAPILSLFFILWITLFAHSAKVKALVETANRSTNGFILKRMLVEPLGDYATHAPEVWWCGAFLAGVRAMCKLLPENPFSGIQTYKSSGLHVH